MNLFEPYPVAYYHGESFKHESLVTAESKYSKTCVKRPLKNRQNKILMTNGRLMKVRSIAECSPWSILQYF